MNLLLLFLPNFPFYWIAFFFSCYPLLVRYLLKFMQCMVNLMNGDDWCEVMNNFYLYQNANATSINLLDMSKKREVILFLTTLEFFGVYTLCLLEVRHRESFYWHYVWTWIFLNFVVIILGFKAGIIGKMHRSPFLWCFMKYIMSKKKKKNCWWYVFHLPIKKFLVNIPRVDGLKLYWRFDGFLFISSSLSTFWMSVCAPWFWIW